jgi:Domain of unknown function (DUF4410)
MLRQISIFIRQTRSETKKNKPMKPNHNPNHVVAREFSVCAFRQESSKAPAARRGRMFSTAACLFATLLVAGCASTKVTDRQQLQTGYLPRPGTIWVYDFAASPNEVPANSVLASQYAIDVTSQTPQQIAEGRKLGADIAADLVGRIQAMGMPSQRAYADTRPRLNDIVIRGYLISVNKGSAAKRVVIGFGAGGSELKTAVEGYQMTAQGLRKLGSGAVQSGGGKTPGAAVGAATFAATANPAGLIISSGMKIYGEASGRSTIKGRAEATAKEIAKVLKQRFKQQGWIN